MNTLVYIRRSKSFNDSVLEYAEKYLETTKLTTISEYFNGDFRIDMNSSKWDSCSQTQKFIDEKLDLSKLIFRDRVLRNTPHSESLMLIRRAVGEVLDIFASNSFDSLVIYPVDNYIMDILVEVSLFYHVKVYGVCNFFMSGYKRITIYGEYNYVREPADDEVNNAIALLTNNFKSHMAPNRALALKRAIIRYLKYKLRFPIFYLLGAKLLNRKEYDLLATPYITTVRSFANFFVERLFTPISKIDFSKNSILVPLHYFPEATIEYWTGDIRLVDFEHMLKCKVDELSKRYEQVILKEHPATVYDNSSHFYKTLLKNPKVVIVEPFVATSTILKQVETVGVWTGTTGIEALVNGKKTEFFIKSQYYFLALEKSLSALNNCGHDNVYSIDDSHTFMREVLSGTIIT